MPLILLGVSVFTGVVVALIALLLWARRQLVPAGEMLVLINDEPGKALKVPAGQTLLTALASRQVLIPSACGGKGTCGLCRVKVANGGEALPTERGFLTRGELLDGVRLACQVKIKGDLKIEVPAEAFEIRRWSAEVISNESVADFIKELVVKLPEGFEVPFKAGQYVVFTCPPHTVHYQDFEIPERYRKSWDRWELWRLTSVASSSSTSRSRRRPPGHRTARRRGS